MSNSPKSIVWMDIPVVELDRACRFYEGVLACEVRRDSYEQMNFAVFESDDGDGGCLVPDPAKITAELGPLVYMNVDGRIRDATAKVGTLGGKVVQEVHPIGPHGWRALIVDSEGNRMALHSTTDS